MSYMQGQWHRLNFSFKKHLDLSAVDVSPCMPSMAWHGTGMALDGTMLHGMALAWHCMALCCRPLVRYHIITFDLQLQQSPHSHFRQN